MESTSNNVSSTATAVARAYYDSADADTFYHTLWGGEDLHIGIYTSPTETIARASRRTVEHMASIASPITPTTRILDIGSGYGGAARYLAKTYGCKVTCLNLSGVENERNGMKIKEQGLGDLVEVVEGSFEAMPLPDHSYDLVWSQDAFLHSGDRAKIVAEIDRVLVTEVGKVVFTDPMAAEGAKAEGLQPIQARLQLESLGTLAFYRTEFEKRGFRDMGFEEHTEQLVASYSKVLKELEGQEEQLKGKISDQYIRNMKVGLDHWINGGKNGQLCWGILHFVR
ncbi:hypothetical protein JMJ35_002338 [Cladonia borealis]|uniref:Methyltransferase type 11 domain-containing protein n=1 Tax=Cladonia borealis TaxID=184061 RepID=A0AA39R761_9LECA|nr:hypothetical protein JMJ35_002338 [Cladonia borealis]